MWPPNLGGSSDSAFLLPAIMAHMINTFVRHAYLTYTKRLGGLLWHQTTAMPAHLLRMHLL